jgi:predicted nucleic acid-binding protein
VKLADALADVQRLFLDTAPVVYFVEANARYLPIVEPIFDQLDAKAWQAVASPITLSECLVIPYRLQDYRLQALFTQLLVKRALFSVIDEHIASSAAQLRSRYNLTLPDAMQVAVAQASGCQAFLTNDMTLKRITGLRVVVLDELEVE